MPKDVSGRSKRRPKVGPTRREVEEGLRRFEALDDYMSVATKGIMKRGQFFSLCTRASLAKCYEYNLLAWDHRRSLDVFFSLPTLRGICEDVIVLNYIKSMSNPDRETLTTKLMFYELHSRLSTQHAFFSTTRPLQPVLGPTMSQRQVEDLAEEIRTVWRSNGWPGMNRKVMPPIREMAQKKGGDVLGTLYDYLYRLTSNTVHFSVGSLVRTGWGEDENSCSFSTRHLSPYYATFGRLYGAFLFCTYFELFGRTLRPGKPVQAQVHEIRKGILSTVRWPEMVTFEEMNVPLRDPGLLIRALSVVVALESKRLLAH